MSTPKYAWLDGLVPWEDATCHVSSLAFKYGAAVFEGIRAYWDPELEKLALWQADLHLARLEHGQRFMRYDDVLSADAVGAALVELLRANAFTDHVHITATAFLSGPGQPFVCGPVSLAITAMQRNDYKSQGVRVQVSSWRRVPDASQPQRVKATGNYLNGRLASVQARGDGYDTALMLGQDGKVSEGPAMCFFMVRNGRVITPDRASDILDSITRETVLTLASEAGLPVEERKIDRSELSMADEAFFCGTAWEIAPIVSIDGLSVGQSCPGPITQKLMSRFEALTTGRDTSHPEWRKIID